jgi:transcriptional regulator with XRE-family HTH domain
MRSIDPNIGRRLAAIRRSRGFSQSALAAAIGVSKGLIALYETSGVEIKLSRLDELAAALRCKRRDFFQPVDAPTSRRKNQPAEAAEVAAQISVMRGEIWELRRRVDELTHVVERLAEERANGGALREAGNSVDLRD